MSDRIYNFSAGPACLPTSVVAAARDALVDLGGSGIGVMEHSHRGAEFSEALDGAIADCRALASIPDDYEIVFMHGGASSQFFTVPMNLLGPEQTADYINTGVWSQKAIKEAALFGEVHLAASSEDSGFDHIPRAGDIRCSEKPAYLHVTSNNTIYGTQFATEPTPPAGVPLICDASSDIFSRPIDISRYRLIYAGAQKNLGPAGVALVIIHRDLVARGATKIPTMLQYRTHVESGSRFNTPPTFAIYVVGQVLRWLREFGGLDAIAAYNRAKAALLYEFLDESALFHSKVRADSRSLMNVTFHASTPDIEAEFLKECSQRGFVGLKGHRSVGGLRASIYNAFPEEGVRALIAFMKEFEHAR